MRRSFAPNGVMVFFLEGPEKGPQPGDDRHLCARVANGQSYPDLLRLRRRICKAPAPPSVGWASSNPTMTERISGSGEPARNNATQDTLLMTDLIARFLAAATLASDHQHMLVPLLMGTAQETEQSAVRFTLGHAMHIEARINGSAPLNNAPLFLAVDGR